MLTSSNAESISNAIARLRGMTQQDILPDWRFSTADLNIDAVTSADFSNWSIGSLNPKRQIVWPQGLQVVWLAQQIAIPPALNEFPLEGYCLRLALTWWAEDVEIYVNGKLVESGDLLDYFTRVLLSSRVMPGDEITIALRLVSPSHCEGALMRSLLVYESNLPGDLEPGFIADELDVLSRYLAAKSGSNIDILADAIAQIDWNLVSNQAAFSLSLQHLRQTLKSQIPQPEAKIYLVGHAHLDMAWLWPVAETWEAAERTFESVLKLQQDFPDLIFCHSTPALYDWIEQHRPDLLKRIQDRVKSGQWEIVGGMWIEPDLNLIDGESIVRQILYAQRYTQTKFGQITTVAWVPDTFGFCATLPQFLKQGGIEFFVTQKLAWNDTTKFPHSVFWWQSPDGTKIFSLMSALIGETIDPLKMTDYAIAWQQKTNLPDALWLPGVGDHGGGPTRDMLEVAARWQDSPFLAKLEFTTVQNYLQHLLSKTDTSNINSKAGETPTPQELFAQSDGADLQHLQSKTDTSNINSKAGETPTPQELFDKSDRAALQHLPSNTAKSNINSKAAKNSKLKTQNSKLSPPPPLPHSPTPPLPIWADELYLEFHRGCYTTHADQKFYNRRCERLLYQAELFASIAAIATNSPYPDQLEQVWKQVLFNQFHDILPGTSISQVFVEANLIWQEVLQAGEQILLESLNAIANQISLPSPPHPDAIPFVVFNSLNWQRAEVISLHLPSPTADISWCVCDLNGYPLPSQISPNQLLFVAENIPAVGYRLFWLSPQNTQDAQTQTATRFEIAPYIYGRIFSHNSIHNLEYNTASEKNNSFGEKDGKLENEFLAVVVDGKTGNIASIFDKQNQREILDQSGGNQLQAFKDSGQYWDAWNIDPNYQQHPLPAAELKSIEWIERGEIQTRLRVVRQIGASKFIQDYILSAGSSVLKIATTVDWQERQVLVKAAFGLNLAAEEATYEIPCGAIKRTTRPQTATEKAKWEVPAIRWADLTQEIQNPKSKIQNRYGVSLLNDCKYGYDSQPNQLRLTLLRSPSWPDPDADKGQHQFTYAIYPHAGSWQRAHTARKGYELNVPLQAIALPTKSDRANTTLPPVGCFINISAENLILMAFKQAEDHPDEWILRCYEAWGEPAELSYQGDLDLEIAGQVDLLERPKTQDERSPSSVQISPWQITSLQLKKRK